MERGGSEGLLTARWDGPSQRWIDSLSTWGEDVVADAVDRIGGVGDEVLAKARRDVPFFEGDTRESLERRSETHGLTGSVAIGSWRTVPELEDGNSALGPFNLALGLDQGIKRHYVRLYNPVTGVRREKLYRWARQSRKYRHHFSGHMTEEQDILFHVGHEPTYFLTRHWDDFVQHAVDVALQAAVERW